MKNDVIKFPKDISEIDIFPTQSAGDGSIRDSSLKKGEGQGISTSKLISRCKQCGWRNDLSRTDHSGGTYLGDGGLGEITKFSNQYDSYGDRDVNNGAGCSLCGSKNIVGK
jgi:hypothetical protein